MVLPSLGCVPASHDPSIAAVNEFPCRRIQGMRVSDGFLGRGFGSVVGGVFGMDGRPLEHVQVSADSTLARGALSDETGVFRLDSVPAGLQTISFRHIGHYAQTQQVLVMTGNTEVVCAVLQKAAVPLNH